MSSVAGVEVPVNPPAISPGLIPDALQIVVPIEISIKTINSTLYTLTAFFIIPVLSFYI